MILSIAEPEVGAPKTNRASKKGKKSWRKNVDMSQVNQHLEEVRHEERVGGSFADRPDEKLFVIEKEVKVEESRKPRKEPKKLRCFANLEGLPGVPDPKPLRNKTLLPEERENPLVKKLKEDKIKAGIIGQKTLEKVKNRKRHLEIKDAGKTVRNSRRRTVFDFDLWDAEDKVSKPSEDWVDQKVLTHTAQGQCQYTPKAAAVRNFSTGTTLPAVEVPESGASYNPSAKDHQDLLWKAALVEIQKQKEQERIQRQTTAMFPEKGEAPTTQDYLQEMSEGIIELKQKDKEEEEKEEKEEKEENGESIENDAEKELSSSQVIRPKTRKQKRDKRGRMFEKQRERREKETKLREMELMRTKSLTKELKKEELKTEANQKRRAQEKMDKMGGSIQLSNYKYEPQEIEIKLSDELTGNLRSLKPEGSILEDRFKSLQRRNMIEVRVKQKTVRKLKRKKIEKRSHRMGWEENKNVIAKRIRQEAKQRRKARQATTA